MTSALAPTADELPPIDVDLATQTPVIEIYKQPPLRPLNLAELLALDVKPRAQLLAPLIPEKGLAMLYAQRGIGKTHMALGMGYAIAAGGTFLRWKAPAPRKVLLLDGEMPLIVLQGRLSSIVSGSDVEALAENFLILAADAFENGLPNLATAAGQAAIEPLLDSVALLIVDNISTLASNGKDNDAESWSPIQEWLLRLRRRGISVLLIHHAGKGGQQRGTSRREDVLDTVINLRRPSDYNPIEGARFEVHIEKARGAYGDDVKPFEAKLELVDKGATWSTRDLADADLARVIDLAEEGLSIRDIAEETGLTKSTVQRMKKKAEADGHVFPKASS
jgi:putative DNA primase/helicase